MTPSVTLLCEIPELAESSFCSGKVCVGVKDSIFEGSNPFRHTVELLDVLRSHGIISTPYLSPLSDGGGDHNITFLYVQCMLLALFRIGGFDMLNVGRCTPLQSYINPADRAMSLLNIGLQGLALECDDTGISEPTFGSYNSVK